VNSAAQAAFSIDWPPAGRPYSRRRRFFTFDCPDRCRAHAFPTPARLRRRKDFQICLKASGGSAPASGRPGFDQDHLPVKASPVTGNSHIRTFSGAAVNCLTTGQPTAMPQGRRPINRVVHHQCVINHTHARLADMVEPDNLILKQLAQLREAMDARFDKVDGRLEGSVAKPSALRDGRARSREAGRVGRLVLHSGFAWGGHPSFAGTRSNDKEAIDVITRCGRRHVIS
jgi:hypothetical protein